MEEASSIMKAIENGWTRAGKPQEFSVKIFEEAQKNFFGFTSKPAKIGIFIPFNQTPKGPQTKESDHSRSSFARSTPAKQSRPQESGTQPTKINRPEHRSAETTHLNRRPIPHWTEELGSFAQHWLAQCLTYLPISHATVNKEMSQELLSLYIANPMVDSSEKQQALLKSLAHLTMEALRNKFKQNFRSLRILIIIK